MSKAEDAYSDLLAELVYTCPGAPSSVVERMLMRAMRFLAKETCLLQTTIRPAIQAGVAQYNLEAIEEYEICQIMCVTYCGCCIDHIKKCKPGQCGYEMKGLDCIEIHPCPDGALEPGDLEVLVALVPSYDACELFDDMMKHQEVIREMAMVNLMSMPKQKWSDFRLASAMKRNLMADIAELRCDVRNNFTDEPLEAGSAIMCPNPKVA